MSTQVRASDGAQLNVHQLGTAGGPPMVVAHGFSDDGACWSRFAERVDGSYSVLAPDARNHGSSDRSAVTNELLADDLASVITAFECAPVVLMGHSLGATASALCAARHPELVGALILEDPPWKIDAVAPVDRAAVREWITGLSEQTDDELHALGRTQHPRWPIEEFDTWVPAKRGLGPGAADHLAPIDWEATVGLIECPTLVVLGNADDDDAIATVAVGSRIAALNPRTTVVQINDAGHNIRRESFDAFVAAIRAFCDTVE